MGGIASRVARGGVAVIAVAAGVFCVVAAVALAMEPHAGVDDPGTASLVVSLLLWSAIALGCFFVAWALTLRRRR